MESANYILYIKTTECIAGRERSARQYVIVIAVKLRYDDSSPFWHWPMVFEKVPR